MIQLTKGNIVKTKSGKFYKVENVIENRVVLNNFDETRMFSILRDKLEWIDPVDFAWELAKQRDKLVIIEENIKMLTRERDKGAYDNA